MVDSGIKKSKVLKKDLPTINSLQEGYEVRYRVVSEDKNRTSHWSPITLVQPDYTFISGEIDFNKSGNIVTSIWDQVEIKKNSTLIEIASEYDIWVRFDRNDSGDWIYKQRVQGNIINIIIPTTYTINGVVQVDSPNKYSIEVYLKGTPISRDTSFLRVYQDGPHTV